MLRDGKLLIAKGEKELFLLPKMANRHGLIAGATGTGKTTTLKVMAESFSRAGVPVFLADIKGDLGGMIKPGTMSRPVQSRVEGLDLYDFSFTSFSTRFWDVYGEKGHPVRTTVSELGPTMLARILGLSDVQAGILNIAFRIADENGWLLLDLKDLKSVLQFISQNYKELSELYGRITPQSATAILRSVLVLEDQGGEFFFGEPAFDVRDWMRTSYDGKGFINILYCERLFQSPVLYSTFMLWLLSELYETLPERGDLDKPKMVFFFDEAHLLFEEAPKALLQKIEQVVRLIRSKAVGVYFITQTPNDIPDSVLAQLGNRVQHALRAYTPAELKKVKAAADTFRENPNFKTLDVITTLNTGEALVSFLDEKGAPTVVEKATILPPQSQMGSIDDTDRRMSMAGSGMGGKYDDMVDRESAYEILLKVAEESRMREEEEARQKLLEKEEAELQKRLEKEEAARLKQEEKEAAARRRRIEKIATVAATSLVTNRLKGKGKSSKTSSKVVKEVARQGTSTIVRGILGSLLK